MLIYLGETLNVPPTPPFSELIPFFRPPYAYGKNFMVKNCRKSLAFIIVKVET